MGKPRKFYATPHGDEHERQSCSPAVCPSFGAARRDMDLARNLKIESVSRLHPTPPLHVQPLQSVAEAVELMRRVLAPGKPLSEPVSAHMTPNPIVVNPKEPIGAAVRLMEEGGYRHLPVVDELGRPLGVLSVKRIIHYLVEHFPGTVYNLPPEPGAVQQCREGA